MAPIQFGPRTSGSPQPVPLDKRNILWTICPGGPNWLGTICPCGLNWLGTNCGGPNVRGPYAVGTECVTAREGGDAFLPPDPTGLFGVALVGLLAFKLCKTRSICNPNS